MQKARWLLKLHVISYTTFLYVRSVGSISMRCAQGMMLSEDTLFPPSLEYLIFDPYFTLILLFINVQSSEYVY